MTVAQETGSRVTATRLEELGRIIMAYSEVTEKLQESHERLEKTVTALREELSEKNQLLERKNRLAALGEMAAGMAHEIRNPLGGIRLYASMLEKDMGDRPESLTVVKKIAHGVKRLEGLVSQVLHFTREIRINAAEADLGEIVEHAVELASGKMQHKGVLCHIRGCGPMGVVVDANLITQAVLNLILNAVDAVGESGKVEIEFGKPWAGGEGKQFHLAVRDSGPGIPPDIMGRIFDPFFTTKANGTGLGLAIVHRIVEAHDGSIAVSNVQGGGARFEITI